MAIITKPKNIKESEDVLNFLVKDVGANWGFNTVQTVEDYCKIYGPSSNNIISYDPEKKVVHGCLYKHKKLFYRDTNLTPVKSFIGEVRKAERDYNASVANIDPVFLMGFEIEGCIDPEYKDDFVAFVHELYPNAHDNLVHRDGSIRPKSKGMEISTPPLPQNEAIEKLEWLFGMISILSEEGLFETNHTTGFHVNISEVNTFRLRGRAIRARYAYNFIKLANPEKWRSKFRRSKNKYCFWESTPLKIEDVDKCANHWCAINTQHLNVNNPLNRRIEVRVAGGTNYPEKTAEFLLDIQDAMLEAYRAL